MAQHRRGLPRYAHKGLSLNMNNLVLLILGAVWAAVLIPPLLQNRIENRPNSSVTDFRRQLNKLQSAVPSRATGSHRMARPLAQSPLQRPAAGGRPGQAAQARRGAPRQHGRNGSAPRRQPRGAQQRAQQHGDTLVRRDAPSRGQRSHGDPSGGMRRPTEARRTSGQQRRRQEPRAASTRQRAPQQRAAQQGASQLRRRRTNVLWMMVAATGASLLLAATSREPVLLYVFAISFVALCGYLYLLGQARQRDAAQWGNDWIS